MFGYQKQTFLKLPTPVSFLPNLSERLDIQLYMKRDDLTEFGGGGNKLRKLEYLLHDAREKGATMLITVGGKPRTADRCRRCQKSNEMCHYLYG